MAKNITAERARKARLAEGRRLVKERTREIKAKEKLVRTRLKVKQDARKNRGKTFKKIANTVKYRKTLSSNLHRQFGGAFGGRSSSNQSSGDRPVGRPRGDYKHRSPFDGKPIPATVYYKQLRDFKRMQIQRANQIDQKQVAQLARKGVPPEQAKQIVDTRQLRSVGVQPSQNNQVQMQPQRINPNLPPEIQRQILMNQLRQQNQQVQTQRPNPFASQVPSNIPKHGRRGEFVEGDAFGKPRIKIFGDEKSFWN